MIASTQSAAIAIGVAASVVTYLGGTIAFRIKDRLPLILGLAAGIVVGVALFDLLPEALAIGEPLYGSQFLFAAVALGMVLYMIIDRGLAALPLRYARARSHLGPASLTLHSLIDGLSIGITFRLSSTAGVVVAVGVLTHDIADGINTVTLSRIGNSIAATRRWLIANSPRTGRWRARCDPDRRRRSRPCAAASDVRRRLSLYRGLSADTAQTGGKS